VGVIAGSAFCLGRHIQGKEKQKLRSTIETGLEAQESAAKLCGRISRSYGSISDAALVERSKLADEEQHLSTLGCRAEIV